MHDVYPADDDDDSDSGNDGDEELRKPKRKTLLGKRRKGNIFLLQDFC